VLMPFLHRASPSPHDTSSPANSVGVSSPDTAGTSSTSTNSGSATTVSNLPSQEGGGGGYSTSDKIALGTGIGIGLPAALAAIIGVCIMCRRRYGD
jgi:hypothetical protein